jgi:cardiolipin synthase
MGWESRERRPIVRWLGLPLTVCALSVLVVSCAGVPPPFAPPRVAVGDPSFGPTLEAYTAAPIRSGNRVEVLLNGEQIFPAQLEAIRSAHISFTYAQYLFETGPPANALVRAMSERCQAGVHGHILIDGVGSDNMPSEDREALGRAGCEVAVFHPLDPAEVWQVNHRNHRRVLVVDGRIGFTGSSGASSKWMGNGRAPGYWRQTDVRLEGRAVNDLQAAFVENWLEATGRALGGEQYFPQLTNKGDVPAQIVRGSPERSGFAVYALFLFAISSAQRSIHLTNPYFVPDEPIMMALIEARQRGVRVVLLLPGIIDHEIVKDASRAGFGRLMDAGVEMYEYQAGLLHAKTITIDGVWATVGSANLDNRSLALNEEINLVVYDRAVAGRLEKIFENDLAYSRIIDAQRWRVRSLWQRFMEFLSMPVRNQL